MRSRVHCQWHNVTNPTSRKQVGDARDATQQIQGSFIRAGVMVYSLRSCVAKPGNFIKVELDI
eukprot:m.341853 g.341853  ORF g.341853 m.341853 type:complete len:63 (+) comp20616_c0_seq2:603-791(+)